MTKQAVATIALLWILTFCGSTTFALDSAAVLPEGIHSPAFRWGVIDNIDQKFTTDGRLQTLSDYHSINFDSRVLARIEPRVNELISVLNQFGHQNLGDALSLGVLRIETMPQVQYYAPLHAYGISKRWTIAAGLPIVTYANQISLSESGSNIKAVHGQLGRGIPELNEAFDELGALSLVESADKQLAEKGYKPLSDRQENLVGDLQIASLYRFLDTPYWTAASKTLLNLPTGKGDDPDDLADLGIFGETAIEEIVTLNFTPWRVLRFAARASYRFVLPDKTVKRVPESEADSLPGSERKELVSRDKGDSATFGASGTLNLFPRISAGAGYELMFRGEDRHSGANGWDYALLSRDTGGNSTRVRAAIEYSSTDAYLNNEAILPMQLAYEYSDTIAGRNIERQTVHELWFTLFF